MQLDHLKRRDFISLLGGAVAWPLAARAQQGERVRRVGMLMNVAADGLEGQARLSGFLHGLQQLGWTDRRNVRIDHRWGAGDPERMRKYAAELVALGLDIILASGDYPVVALQRLTRTVPIVFTTIADPVGAGFVENLARPGGNTTGCTVSAYSLSGKWLDLLKEIAPDVKRAERDTDEIERALTASVRSADFSLIATGSEPARIHWDLIVSLAARHKLPTVYVGGFFVIAGGLVSYGPDLVDEHRRAAEYVNAIFRGENPANLPVQAPTKYELVINLKTAKALEIEIPPTVLARADEVIECRSHNSTLQSNASP